MAAIKRKTSVIYAAFGLIIVVFIVLLGISLLVFDYFDYIDKNIKIVIAFLITSYGLFRLVNIYYKNKKQSDEEEDSDSD